MGRLASASRWMEPGAHLDHRVAAVAARPRRCRPPSARSRRQDSGPGTPRGQWEALSGHDPRRCAGICWFQHYRDHRCARVPATDAARRSPPHRQGCARWPGRHRRELGPPSGSRTGRAATTWRAGATQRKAPELADTGRPERAPVARLSGRLGAAPHADWPRDAVPLDPGGKSPGGLPLERSMPGMFDVGDVRQGPIQRVAAVGGSPGGDRRHLPGRRGGGCV